MDSSSIYIGQLTCSVNLLPIKPELIVFASQVTQDPTTEAVVNSLKYRHPLKFLGKDYEQVTVPCIPGHQHTFGQSEHQNKNEGSFVKVSFETGHKAIASGKRSAIVVGENKLLRFKGCGNEGKGFNREHNQSRGHHFWNTAKREMFMTRYINNILEQELKINPPANRPLYLHDYPEAELKQHQIANQLPMIGKYCCVFETQGDRRAGTHLISPLEVIFLTFFDHQAANWKQLFLSRGRLEDDELMEFVANFQLMMEEGKTFLQVYDSSSPISNYITLLDRIETKMVINSEIVQRLNKQLVPSDYHERVAESLSKIESLLPAISSIISRIGWQMGRIKRVMCEKGVSWGFFQDHSVEFHCNAHLNNFIITPPQSAAQSSNYFLLPLDYDLAFTQDEFINIELDAATYGANDKNTFQNYLCAEYTAMEMSLFGLELMNFKYGITEENPQNSQDKKMSRIAFRDTLVASFNHGMRGDSNFGEQVSSDWDKHLKDIQLLVDACLHMSVNFQT